MSAERDDPRDAVDALIDDTARSLTQAEPPVSLRVRVRSAIDTAPRRPPWAWRPALAGAAVVVVAAMGLWRLSSARDPVAPPSVPQRAEGTREASPPRIEPQPTLPDGPAGGETGRVARRVPAAPQTAGVVSRGPASFAPEPLPPIEPIAIEPVQSSAMATIERMPAPMPVEIERLEIEQLFE